MKIVICLSENLAILTDRKVCEGFEHNKLFDRTSLCIHEGL